MLITYGLIGLVLVIVGLGVVTWLYSMTDAGKIDQRGHKLGLW